MRDFDKEIKIAQAYCRSGKEVDAHKDLMNAIATAVIAGCAGGILGFLTTLVIIF